MQGPAGTSAVSARPSPTVTGTAILNLKQVGPGPVSEEEAEDGRFEDVEVGIEEVSELEAEAEAEEISADDTSGGRAIITVGRAIGMVVWIKARRSVDRRNLTLMLRQDNPLHLMQVRSMLAVSVRLRQ